MKQTILKKLLVSGAAAVGIMGLSTPAAFAWSGNSGYGGYSNSHKNYSNYNRKSDYSPCHRERNYSSNMYGGRNLYPSYGNKNENRNNMSSSSSFAVAFAFAASSSNSSSNSFNNRW